jgi:aspartyl-tRNA(Asn)/glutamyl-tRNA(Gln) amidotransferase subunit C
MRHGQWSGTGMAAPRLARMSALSRDDVAHLAGLARIDLSDAELDRMVGELGVILESVAKVQEVAAADIEPMSHPLPLTNVTRPDEVRPSLGADAALAGAPAQEQQRFSVPRILAED